MKTPFTTRFRMLLEIARRQPSVRQLELAGVLNITPQAVSEYIKELLENDFLKSNGPVNYTLTEKGYDLLLRGGRELKDTSILLEDILKDVTAMSAIAKSDLKKDQEVGLEMKDGLLYAGVFDSAASGRVIGDTPVGEDAGIRNIKGVIELNRGKVTIVVIPNIEEGGSRAVDVTILKGEIEPYSYIIALGIEALVSLKKVSKAPDVFFGAKEAAVETAYHGISPVVVAVKDEVHILEKLLENKNVPYELKRIEGKTNPL